MRWVFVRHSRAAFHFFFLFFSFGILQMICANRSVNKLQNCTLYEATLKEKKEELESHRKEITTKSSRVVGVGVNIAICNPNKMCPRLRTHNLWSVKVLAFECCININNYILLVCRSNSNEIFFDQIKSLFFFSLTLEPCVLVSCVHCRPMKNIKTNPINLSNVFIK